MKTPPSNFLRLDAASAAGKPTRPASFSRRAMVERLRHVEKLALISEPSSESARPEPPAWGNDATTANHARESENLAHAFWNAACARWNAPALITKSGDYCYGWMGTAALQVCCALWQRPAFRSGSPVAMLVGNSPEYIAAFYGILLAGGVAVPIPPDAEIDRIGHIVDTCAIHTLLSTPLILHQRVQELGNPCGILTIGQSLSSAVVPRPKTKARATDLAAILFTSGSTGVPKGVMLSHRNLLSNACAISEYLRIDASERALVILPFYHAFGNSVLQSHLLSSATLILDGSLAFPNSLLVAMRKYHATSFSGVPEVFHFLLTRSALGREPIPSLRYMAVAGGALRPEEALAVAERIEPAKFFVMYGQTEATARLSYLPPELLKTRAGSAGKGLSGVELQVMDEQGRRVEPGQIGEIRARGPNVMVGYWKDPEGTARAIRDGWLSTGDLATVDQDGFIYPKGRSSALAKIGGFRVHPSELEDFVLKRLPLARAVAVAYESNGSGTRLALFVQPAAGRSSLTEEEVRETCRRELPSYKVPAHVEVMREFPINGAMKLDRPALSRRAERSEVTVRSTTDA